VTRADQLRAHILELVAEYHEETRPSTGFVPGVSKVPVAGKVLDHHELQLLVESSLDGWLTSGRFAAQFEEDFSAFLGVGHAMLCNSGSSANLLAVSALTSERLGERRLRPGDEVITAAAGFPTTVNPIVQNGLVPVFVDISMGTYDADVSALAEAVGPRTRAIVMAHTLGNPFDLDVARSLAAEHDLWLIEDNCDALGSRFRGQLTGTFGDLATVSFYPAHHITMGEGGCVLASKGSLAKIVESFRDWGRDCWCEPGCDNTCGRRFDWQLGDLPYGYDHKYIYSQVGYNLKLTDMQAAVGVAQLPKLPGFIEARKRNWQRLHDGLADLDCLILPEATHDSEPSWFGFAVTIRPGSPFTRHSLVGHLESRRIATRQLFAGNLARQPAYRRIHHRVVGDLQIADTVTDQTFWLGVYPGLTAPMVDYVIESVRDFVASAT